MDLYVLHPGDRFGNETRYAEGRHYELNAAGILGAILGEKRHAWFRRRPFGDPRSRPHSCHGGLDMAAHQVKGLYRGPHHRLDKYKENATATDT